MSLKSYQVLITAANKLAKNYAKKFISTALKPVDYTRTKEIPAIFNVSGILARKNEKLRILDIGSPQVLSLALGLHSNLWDIIYFNPFEMELEDLRLKSLVLHLSNLKIIRGDVTNLATISMIGESDYIFSCSVFEHIHPETLRFYAGSKKIGDTAQGGLSIYLSPEDTEHLALSSPLPSNIGDYST